MKLADYLTERDLSAAEFAFRIGVHRSTVSRWLEGSTNGGAVARPSWDQIIKVHEETGGLVTANDFMVPDAATSAAEAAHMIIDP